MDRPSSSLPENRKHPLEAAIDTTSQGVEIMLVHNLWGPQVVTMKDKNVSIVKTRRSGSLCYEFESFLYKYGAEIYIDSAEKHDLLMGVSQKLPTAISVALAITLTDHQIDLTTSTVIRPSPRSTACWQCPASIVKTREPMRR